MKTRVLTLSNEIRPAVELVAELAAEAPHFFELALLVAEDSTDQVHFIWHTSTNPAQTEFELTQLIARGWIPVGLIGVRSDGRLMARPLREHANGRGIKRYLRKLLDRAAKIYISGFGDPPSRTIH